MNDYEKPYKDGENMHNLNMIEGDSCISSEDGDDGARSVVAIVAQESLSTNGDPCSIMLWGEESDGHIMDRSA